MYRLLLFLKRQSSRKRKVFSLKRRLKVGRVPHRKHNLKQHLERTLSLMKHHKSLQRLKSQQKLSQLIHKRHNLNNLVHPESQPLHLKLRPVTHNQHQRVLRPPDRAIRHLQLSRVALKRNHSNLRHPEKTLAHLQLGTEANPLLKSHLTSTSCPSTEVASEV